MEFHNVTTVCGARTFLQIATANGGILDEIKKIIYTWEYKSEYNLNAIRNDLRCIIETVITQYYADKRQDKEIYQAVHCVVYNDIYENLIPLIRGKFSKEDLYLYEKCKYFYKMNVAPEEFESNNFNSVPFTAAIVELSVLDNFKSPLEKLNCLQSTYDLIFAEVKLALVSLISKYSEKECEIPIINNDEIIPILTIVVIKSKLLYLYSNLFYIKHFGESLLQENYNMRNVLDTFETVVQKLMEIEESSLKTSPNMLSPNLGIRETIEIISFEETSTKENNNLTLFDEEKKRLSSLITSSMEENSFIPTDLPRIFS